MEMGGVVWSDVSMCMSGMSGGDEEWDGMQTRSWANGPSKCDGTMV